MHSQRNNLKVFLSDQTDPAWNLALEEYITFHTEPGEVILFLWQNDDTIVIGRNQNLTAEVRVEEFLSEGGTIVRRLSGGGAVYHDLGNLNFTFAARKRYYNVERQVDVILEAVRRCGIEAEKNGRNDLTADGCKFSGHAYYKSGDFCYHHGTLLVDADQDRMTQFLSPSRTKLAKKGVSSVRSRIINLTQMVPGLTVEELSEALITSFAELYGGQPEPYVLPEQAVEQIAERALHFSSKEWIWGKDVQNNFTRGHCFSWGEAEVRIRTDGEEVQECVIYSDAMEQELIKKAQDALIGVEFDSCAMSESILSVPVDKDHVIMRDDLAKLFS